MQIYMNTKLVDSLVQIIESLTPEEKALLNRKLKPQQNQKQQEYQKLLELRARIFVRRGGQLLIPPGEEIIRQMREERTDELVQACFSDLERSDSPK
jgi:hypothetical protein